jgi:hypothetical protein
MHLEYFLLGFGVLIFIGITFFVVPRFFRD